MVVTLRKTRLRWGVPAARQASVNCGAVERPFGRQRFKGSEKWFGASEWSLGPLRFGGPGVLRGVQLLRLVFGFLRAGGAGSVVGRWACESAARVAGSEPAALSGVP
jgi:hypothetical protein